MNERFDDPRSSARCPTARRSALVATMVAVAAVVVSCGGAANDGSANHPETSAALDDSSLEHLSPEDQKRVRTALHASVSVELGTVRGLIEITGMALQYPSLGLTQRARRSVRDASRHFQTARGHHLAARYGEVRSELRDVLRRLGPALTELSRVAQLPDPLSQEFRELVAESEHRLDGVVRAIKPIAYPDTLAHYDSSRNLFIQAEQDLKAGRAASAMRRVTDALRALSQAIGAQWGPARQE